MAWNAPDIYDVATILALKRIECLRMVSKGLETLINIRNSTDLAQKMHFIDKTNWPFTSHAKLIDLFRHTQNLMTSHFYLSASDIIEGDNKNPVATSKGRVEQRLDERLGL